MNCYWFTFWIFLFVISLGVLLTHPSDWGLQVPNTETELIEEYGDVQK